MSEQRPTGEIYGRLTGRKRLAIILLGAASGVAIALMFASFGRQPVNALELIAGAVIGAFLGWSASLGEKRRSRGGPG
jgi:hypothetical protein